MKIYLTLQGLLQPIKITMTSKRIRKSLLKNQTQIFKTFNLKYCSSHNKTLFFKGRLWVPAIPKLQAEFIFKCSELPAYNLPGRSRTLELVKREFYLRSIKDDISRYFRNCYTCQQSKTPRDCYNRLLQALPILQQQLQDISMDFITELSISNRFNPIFMMGYCLSKERYYAFCVATNKETSAEATANILMRYVFRCYELPKSIILDQSLQLVLSTWKV